jgi:energy-converting hydrogenase Eha subunit C
MGKTQIVLQIVTLLQGTPVDDFARLNLLAEGDRVVVRCARETRIDTAAGQACKRAIATALLRYSYRFTVTELHVLADLYATALEQLEPEAVARVRRRMCDPASEEARRDAAAALAVCERLSMDY